jgi:hypothetical protein
LATWLLFWKEIRLQRPLHLRKELLKQKQMHQRQHLLRR